MFVVDTNIFIYAADQDAPEHLPCQKFLSSCLREDTPWYLAWGIVYEFLRVVTHPRVFADPMTTDQAWDYMRIFLDAPATDLLKESDQHATVARDIFVNVPLLTGNRVFDARTAALMRENGIRKIYTRDRDFHRFPFLEVIDPLTL